VFQKPKIWKIGKKLLKKNKNKKYFSKNSQKSKFKLHSGPQVSLLK
jgi:hypothetical protein